MTIPAGSNALTLGWVDATVYLSFAVLACTKKLRRQLGGAVTTVPEIRRPTMPKAGLRRHGARPTRKNERASGGERSQEGTDCVPAGTAIPVSLGSSSAGRRQAGQLFSGTVAKDVTVGDAVAIRKGASVSGTVADAKPLGKFSGGARTQLRLNSISVKGSEMQIQTASKNAPPCLLAVVRLWLESSAPWRRRQAAHGPLVAERELEEQFSPGKQRYCASRQSAVSFELSQPLEIKR